MGTLYVVIMELPNEKPDWRVVGVFRDRDVAQIAGEFECEEAGNDATFHIVQGDDKDLNRRLPE